MKISVINGSPKSGASCSGLLLNQLQKDILDKAGANVSSEDFAAYRINITPLSDTDVAEIAESDIIVVAFPLYVDGIPSHMLAALYQLEEAFSKVSCPKKTILYGIINNGFSEGIQNQNAANMLELFCKRAGISFGQVLAIGAGEMMRSMIEANMPFGKASLSYVREGWNSLVNNIVERKSAPTVFCSPNMPGWIFRIAANHTFWDSNSRKNGITKKQMCRRKIYSPEQ